jgi:hypothetical protein
LTKPFDSLKILGVAATPEQNEPRLLVIRIAIQIASKCFKLQRVILLWPINNNVNDRTTPKGKHLPELPNGEDDFLAWLQRQLAQGFHIARGENHDGLTLPYRVNVISRPG